MWDLFDDVFCTFARTSKKVASLSREGTDVYCPLLRPTRWLFVLRFIRPFALVVEQLTLVCMEKNTFVAMLRFFVRNFSISMSFVFLFFQTPGLRRSSFRWVKAETSLWQLCWSVSWEFRVATRILGFWFSTSLTHCESYRALNKKSMVIPMDLRSKTWLDDWMVGRKYKKQSQSLWFQRLDFKLCAYFAFSKPFYPDCLFQIHPCTVGKLRTAAQDLSWTVLILTWEAR